MFEGGANRGFTGFSQNCVREIGSVISLSVTNHFMPEMDIRPLSSLPDGNKLVDNVTMFCINENMFTVATIKNGKFDKIVLNNVPFEIAFMGGRIQIGKDALKFKEERNSFIITGRRKASPTFLFAFFLRYSVKTVEVISGQMPKTIVIVAKNLTDDFRQKLMDSCKFAKLNSNNVQIHEYKIVEIKTD
uniref:Uncharacterized protein n=1 Tax=Panagrolaimus sp. ES5 TaxID=591445 RepID=A0AC34GPU9_9BILA